MAENKKSVLLYCDLIHTVEGLNDKEAGRLFKHYLRYINDLNPVAPDKVTKITFEPIKQALKRDLKKWEAIIQKKRDAGNASAEKRRQQMLTGVGSVEHNPTESTVRDSVNVSVKDNVISIASAAGEIDLEQVKYFLSGATDRRFVSMEQIDSEAKEFKLKYDGRKIGNLVSLCNTWASNMIPWKKEERKLVM